MQWNIYVNQKLFCEHYKDLDLKDAVLFDYLKNFYPHAKKKEAYAYISYRYIIENLPLLGIRSRDVIGRRMKKLKRSGLINFYYDTTDARVYYCLLSPHSDSSVTKESQNEAVAVGAVKEGKEGSNLMPSEVKEELAEDVLEISNAGSLQKQVAAMNRERGFIQIKDSGWQKIQDFYEKSLKEGHRAANPIEVLEAVYDDEFWGSKAFLSKHYHHYQGVYHRRQKKGFERDFERGEKKKRALLFNTDEILFGRVGEGMEKREEEYES